MFFFRVAWVKIILNEHREFAQLKFYEFKQENWKFEQTSLSINYRPPKK